MLVKLSSPSPQPLSPESPQTQSQPSPTQFQPQLNPKGMMPTPLVKRHDYDFFGDTVYIFIFLESVFPINCQSDKKKTILVLILILKT